MHDEVCFRKNICKLDNKEIATASLNREKNSLWSRNTLNLREKKILMN